MLLYHFNRLCCQWEANSNLTQISAKPCHCSHLLRFFNLNYIEIKSNTTTGFTN